MLDFAFVFGYSLFWMIAGGGLVYFAVGRPCSWCAPRRVTKSRWETRSRRMSSRWNSSKGIPWWEF